MAAEPLGSRFAKLWAASTTSALGTGLATIAAPLFVAAHTKSPLIVSATSGVAWLPWLLFALPGGVLVDRVDRRRLMVAIDWMRVAAMGVLTTGFLFVLAAWVPFFVNTGTYAASAVLVALVAGTYRAVHPAADGAGQPRTIRAELAEGFGWLAGQRVLRTMTVLIGLLNLTLTAATAVLVLLAKERLHLGPVGYGALFTCEAAGALLGSACGDWLIRRVTATWTIRIGLLVEAGLHLTLAITRSAYLAGLMMFAFGVHAEPALSG